ncbi:hypothetical protein ATANTOWER_010731 [Ataeniobius toweri]|uniref:Uncharacterized protein n=1 Tax=Ataeniobius toweri TaxID=208326 RepID=A0ABU7ANT6_9TELE|nr:hypothetical protein [Ataeniobius toweri]
MWVMLWSGVVKKELCKKVTLSIYQSIYIPTLTYGLQDRLRAYVIWGYFEGSQQRWVGSLFRMAPGPDPELTGGTIDCMGKHWDPPERGGEKCLFFSLTCYPLLPHKQETVWCG